jgi:hypothetical protein
MYNSIIPQHKHQQFKFKMSSTQLRGLKHHTGPLEAHLQFLLIANQRKRQFCILLANLKLQE